VWFRNDLRIRDNTALEAACTKAKELKIPLAGFFLICPEQWKDHDLGAPKIDFHLRAVHALKQDLEENYKIPLIIRISDECKSTHRAEHIKSSVAAVLKLADELNASHLYANQEYEINESRRDEEIKIQSANTQIHLHHDQCVVAPGLIITQSSQQAYKFYTPFKNAWIKLVKQYRSSPSQDYLRLREEPIKREKEMATVTTNNVLSQY